jgi:hypothetical protein
VEAELQMGRMKREEERDASLLLSYSLSPR